MRGDSKKAMSKAIIEEIIQQLMRGKICVCKPFCGHWEAHAARVLSKYFPASQSAVPKAPIDLTDECSYCGNAYCRGAFLLPVFENGKPRVACWDCAQTRSVKSDIPPRHHKNCAIWTVTRDGEKNACDCGLERKRFQEHLEYASRLAATWEPWERHILSGAPCGVDSCPCQHPVKKHEVLCRCGSTPEIKYVYPEADDHCPEGSWVVHCVNSSCGLEYYGLTRNDAIEYWNSQQIDVEPYPFGHVGKNEQAQSLKTEKGCACQGCGLWYKVDVQVSDDLWERIKPEGKPEGAGLLCGRCILARIEALDQFDAVTLSGPLPADSNALARCRFAGSE